MSRGNKTARVCRVCAC